MSLLFRRTEERGWQRRVFALWTRTGFTISTFLHFLFIPFSSFPLPAHLFSHLSFLLPFPWFPPSLFLSLSLSSIFFISYPHFQESLDIKTGQRSTSSTCTTFFPSLCFYLNLTLKTCHRTIIIICRLQVWWLVKKAVAVKRSKPQVGWKKERESNGFLHWHDFSPSSLANLIFRSLADSTIRMPTILSLSSFSSLSPSLIVKNTN